MPGAEDASAPEIRPAARDDLNRIVGLCAEHAAYERLPFDGDGLADRLALELFGPSPRARCLVAQAAAPAGSLGGPPPLLGYCAFSAEFSFWSGREYAHMDTLYVVPAARGAGLGSRLLRAAAGAARAGGAAQMQWQTPDWNADALRFYDRAGARGLMKVRYSWDVAAAGAEPDPADLPPARAAAPVLRHAGRAAADALTAGWWTGDPDAFSRTMTEDGVYDASVGEPAHRRAEGRAAVARLARQVMALEGTAEEPSPPAPDPADEIVAGPVTVRRWAYTEQAADGAERRVEGIDVMHVRDGLVAVKDAYRKTDG